MTKTITKSARGGWRCRLFGHRLETRWTRDGEGGTYLVDACRRCWFYRPAARRPSRGG